MTSIEHPNRRPRGQAVVCGASMAGLLAARVVSEFYDTVVVVERDVLPDDASQRRGVAQGHHLHQLLTRGAEIFADLFPGVLDDLRAAGAPVLDGSDPSVFYFRAGPHDLELTGTFTRPDEMLFPFASRPLLEEHIRRRVQAIDNVTFRDGHDVGQPLLDGSGRVEGVRTVDRASGEEHTVPADLVVDATGRSARMPALLETWGYPRPPEHKYCLNLCYSSQFLQLPAGSLRTKLAVSAQPLQRLAGAAILAYEHDTMVLTVMGLDGRQAPTDLPGLLDDAAQMLPPEMITVLRTADPLGGVATQRYRASVWRRYDKLRQFPDGLIVIGDAVCSFNPIWGQGMTSTALQAVALRDSLSSNESDWQRAYFASVAQALRSIWWGNRALDFILTPAEDWRATPKRLANYFVDKVWAAAATDIALTETFLRTIELLDTQAVWFRPAQIKRIVSAYRTKGHTVGPGPYPSLKPRPALLALPEGARLMPPNDGSVPRGRIRRTMPLAGFTARAAGGRLVAGLREKAGQDRAVDQFHERTAERYADLLGHSKGALMKVGQIMSMVDSRALGTGGFYPYQKAMSRLQADAPPMHPDLVREVLAIELGSAVEHFADFTEKPIAAASIGQVHRAIMRDGRQVAVKIQYPGVAQAIRDDLANTELLATFLRFMQAASGMKADVRAVAREAAARISEEVDYRHEAATIATFSELYRDHPFIRVPDVISETSGDRVLTMTYLDGIDWAAAQHADQDLKNTWAEAIIRFNQGSFRHANLLHADPHPGNFRFNADGTVGFVDFGCVKVLPESERLRLVAMTRAVIEGRKDDYRDLMVQAGFLEAESDLTADELYQWQSEGLYEIFGSVQPATYTPETTRRVLQTFFDVRDADHPIGRMDTPDDYVFASRATFALNAVAVGLGATLPMRDIMDDLDSVAEPVTELGKQHHAWARDRGLPSALDHHDHP